MASQNSAAELLAQLPRKGSARSSGMIVGPGTGISDSIPAEVPEGAYIVPADSTQKLGLAEQALGGTVPASVSNGEFQISPEDVQQIGASVLDILRGVTHTTARQQKQDEEPAYADGGLVTDVRRDGNSYSGMDVSGNISVNGQAPGGTVNTISSDAMRSGNSMLAGGVNTAISDATNRGDIGAVGAQYAAQGSGAAQMLASTPGASTTPAAPAAAPMSWADRNAQRNLEVTASSIMPSRERDSAAAKLNSLNTSAQPGAMPQAPTPGAAQPLTASAASTLGTMPSPYSLSARPQQSRFGLRPGYADGGQIQKPDFTREELIAQIPKDDVPPPNPTGGLVNNLPRGVDVVGGKAGAGRGQINPPLADPNAPAPAVAASPAALTTPAVTATAPAPASSGPLGRAASSLMAAPQIQVAQAPNMDVQAPTVQHSGNDWAARKRLENLETAASSITNQRRWGGEGERSPDVVAFQQAFANDLAMQGAEANANQAAMRERGDNARAILSDIGASQRANLQEQGAGARAVMTDQGADRRTAMQELGHFERQKIASQATVDAANARSQPPAGYRYTSDGSLTHIPGGPADPTVRGSRAPLNDTQAKALQFGTRMQEAGKNLDVLAKQGVDQPSLFKRMAGDGVLGTVANTLQSPEQQQVEQSQRDFINAVLRRESGAAIADSEFNNARKQYFPQVGDTPEVIAQKRQNRDIATAGIMAEVPDAEKRVGQVLGAAQKANPDAKAERSITRSGTVNGRRVVQYSDGSVEYAN